MKKLLKKVRKSTNIFDLLSVTPRDADEATMKRAKRKMYLKVHPDKNGDAPWSTEAFQKVESLWREYEANPEAEKQKYYDAHPQQANSNTLKQ